MGPFPGRCELWKGVSNWKRAMVLGFELLNMIFCEFRLWEPTRMSRKASVRSTSGESISRKSTDNQGEIRRIKGLLHFSANWEAGAPPFELASPCRAARSRQRLTKRQQHAPRHLNKRGRVRKCLYAYHIYIYIHTSIYIYLSLSLYLSIYLYVYIYIYISYIYDIYIIYIYIWKSSSSPRGHWQIQDHASEGAKMPFGKRPWAPGRLKTRWFNTHWSASHPDFLCSSLCLKSLWSPPNAI